MIRKISAVLAMVAVILVTGGTGAQAASKHDRVYKAALVAAKAAVPDRAFCNGPARQNVSYGLGTHIYVYFNRSESRSILLNGTDVAAAGYAAALCAVLVGTVTPLSAAGCAAGSVAAAKLAHTLTLRAFNSVNWCLTERIKYIPFTASTQAYWRNCTTGARVS
jgi:hypothetical protein